MVFNLFGSRTRAQTTSMPTEKRQLDLETSLFVQPDDRITLDIILLRQHLVSLDFSRSLGALKSSTEWRSFLMAPAK